MLVRRSLIRILDIFGLLLILACVVHRLGMCVCVYGGVVAAVMASFPEV